MAGAPETVTPQARGRARRGRFDWNGLKTDLRGAVPDAIAALAVTAAIFALLYARVESGVSGTVAVMPSLEDADQYWMYWLCQAFGWSGLLWAWITITLGLLRSGARPGALRVPAARIEKWHRTTSLTTIGLMFGHAFMFFAELVRGNSEGRSWSGRLFSAFVEVFVPGGYTSGTGRVAILLGLFAFYLAIPLGLAFYLRQATGSRMWRALHRFIIVVYVLSVWHTLLYGTNVWYDGSFRTLVWALQLPIAALLLIRLLAPARPSERLRLRGGDGESALSRYTRLAGRITVAAVVVGLLAVLATGRDGGRSPEGPSAEPWPEPVVLWLGLLALLLVLAVVVHRLRPSVLAAASPAASGSGAPAGPAGSGSGSGTGSGSGKPAREKEGTERDPVGDDSC